MASSSSSPSFLSPVPAAASAILISRQPFYSLPLHALRHLHVISIEEGAHQRYRVDQFQSQSTTSTSLINSSNPDDLPSSAPSLLRFHSDYPCSTCSIGFSSSLDLRLHHKSEWHLFNMKRQAQGIKPINEEDWEKKKANEVEDKITEGKKKKAALKNSKLKRKQDGDRDEKVLDDEDDDDDDDASSGSDSDTDSDSELASVLSVDGISLDSMDDDQTKAVAGSSRLTFITTTHRFTVYKSLLFSPRADFLEKTANTLSSRAPFYVSAFQSLTSPSSSSTSNNDLAIFLCLGGRFAGGIFSSSSLTHHKVFQRYTTRRKQGGSQATKDKTTGKAQSIGAQIRRKETVRFAEEVARILHEWSDGLKKCERIFIYAPSFNRALFHQKPDAPHINGKLEKNDLRIRSIPFAVYKPILVELHRVHKELTNIEVVERNADEEEDKKKEKLTETSDKKEVEVKVESKKKSIPEVEEDLILTAIRKNDLAELKRLYASNYQRPAPPTEPIMPAVYAAIKLKNLDLVPFLASPSTSPPPSSSNSSDSDSSSSANLELSSFHPASSIFIYPGADEDVDEPALESNVTGASGVVAWTALHLSCQLGHLPSVSLLLALSADPTLHDSKGRSPYLLAKQAGHSDVVIEIRKFAAKEPLKWDWKREGIRPWDEAEEEIKKKAKQEKLKVKKKAQKLRAKEREKAQAAADAKAARLAAEQAEKKAAEDRAAAAEAEARLTAARNIRAATQHRSIAMAGMSDREKRAAAAEARMKVVSGKGEVCSACGKGIGGIKEYQVNNSKYCSAACLAQGEMKGAGT